MITIIVIETVPWELLEWGAAFHEQSNPSNFGVTKQPFRVVKVLYWHRKVFTWASTQHSLSTKSEVPFRMMLHVIFPSIYLGFLQNEQYIRTEMKNMCK